MANHRKGKKNRKSGAQKETATVRETDQKKVTDEKEVIDESLEKQKFICFCSKKFDTAEKLSGHFEMKEECKALRDAERGQYKKKHGIGKERKARLVKRQITDSKEKAALKEEGKAGVKKGRRSE